MKQFSLLLLLCLSATLTAQQLFPSPGLIYGAVYHPSLNEAPPGTTWDYSLKYEKDTLICGEILHLFRTSSDHNYFIQHSGDQYYQILKTDPCPFMNKHLLYDFSMEAGDTVSGYSPYFQLEQIVLQKDTIFLNDGKPRRRIIFKDIPYNLKQYSIIEGIGYPNYGFLPPAGSHEGEYNELICVRDSSGVIYSNPEADISISCASTACFDPIPRFTFSCNGNQFSFLNQSTFASAYLWDFGDGHTSAEKDPVHEYSNEGCYTVTLSAYTNCQLESQACKEVVNVGGIHYWVPPVELPFSSRQAFVRTNEHWSLVEGNTIRTTHNGGQTWFNYTLPDSFANVIATIQDIYFSSETNGILGGRASYNSSIPEGLTSVFFTIDGGETWTPSIVPDPDDISHVLQINEDISYLGGKYPEPIYITKDGGDFWNAIEGVNASRIRDICAPSNGLLYYCGNVSYDVRFGVIQNGEVILAKEIPLGDQYSGEIPNAIFFLDPQTGWIITSRRVLSTTNGGLDWTIQTMDARGLQDIHFENKDHGLIIGDHGLILESFDGGLSWDSTYCEHKEYVWYRELFWPENTHPFIAGSGQFQQLSDTPIKEDCQTVAIDPVIKVPLRMTIFPNPVGDSRLVQILYSEMAGGELSLLNTSGQLVLKQTVSPSDQTQLDCALLPPGFYVVRLTTREGQLLIDRLIIH